MPNWAAASKCRQCPQHCKCRWDSSLGASQVLNVKLVFDEAAVLRENQSFLERTLDLESTAVHMTTDPAAQDESVASKIPSAEPGKPLVVLCTETPKRNSQAVNGTSADEKMAKLAESGWFKEDMTTVQ